MSAETNGAEPATDGTNPGGETDKDASAEADSGRPDLSGYLAGFGASGINLIPRLIPRQSALFRKLALKSLKNYHKRSGGDALAIDARAGQQLDLTPVKYRTADQCDEGEKPGWISKDGNKTWNAASEGRVVDYLNDVPVVALDRDSHVEAGWLKPRIAEAIELDNYDGVYQNAQLTAVAPVVGDLQTNGAATDGGQINPEDIGLEPNNVGQWAGDALLDLNSGEGYDGMRVSFRKASEWMSETTSTQEMQMQEDRGYLRGKMSGEDGPSPAKLFLYAALFSLAVIGLVLLGPQLLSEGGGGSINPLIIGTLSMFGGL